MSETTTLLPPNASALERAVEGAIRARLEAVPVPLATLWNPDTCPVALLPWLAWALSIDEWDDTWIEAQQRAVIRESYAVHALKGTVHSIKAMLRAAGYGECDIQEGLDARYYDGAIKYDGTHYYGPNAGNWAKYRVFLKQPVSLAQAAMIKRLLQDMAPARCHLVSLHYTQALNLYNGKIRYDGQWTYGVVKQVDII